MTAAAKKADCFTASKRQRRQFATAMTKQEKEAEQENKTKKIRRQKREKMRKKGTEEENNAKKEYQEEKGKEGPRRQQQQQQPKIKTKGRSKRRRSGRRGENDWSQQQCICNYTSQSGCIPGISAKIVLLVTGQAEKVDRRYREVLSLSQIHSAVHLPKLME